MSHPLKITDVVLRDSHQSLLATRFRTEDMLPICEKMDQVGYWSVESWGGATFDACIRYLGEDPWERLRQFKKHMPNTKQQMLLRGQNGLGYRHYADDVIEKFVERAVENGMDVFRIFDAMNDVRNLQTAIQAAVACDSHAQGTICYTASPVHTVATFVDMGKRLEDLGSHSICIKDMAGLLKPYVAEELVGRLKEAVELPITLHCHATTGLSTATYVKAIDAGLDMCDTAISSMSMTYGHSATESLVSIYKDTARDTGLDIERLEEIAAYFRAVRKKYAKFEGSLRGVDSRILVAQVPGGMLTNLENQLREQGAEDRLDEVLDEIPAVRKDLGYIPLVTPTSQIVGTQAVINVLSGERYKTLTKEAAGVLRGEYGATAAPVDQELQAQALEPGQEPISVRPADLIADEMDKLTTEFRALAKEKGIRVAEHEIDDVLIYAQFPQVGLKYLENRDNPEAFEPHPDQEPAAPIAQAPAASKAPAPASGPEAYTVAVNGKSYHVVVAPGGEVTDVQTAVPTPASPVPASPAAAPVSSGAVSEMVTAPMAGTIIDILVETGQDVSADTVVIVLEAMKMETEIRCATGGVVQDILVGKGDAVNVGQALLSFA